MFWPSNDSTLHGQEIFPGLVTSLSRSDIRKAMLRISKETETFQMPAFDINSRIYVYRVRIGRGPQLFLKRAFVVAPSFRLANIGINGFGLYSWAQNYDPVVETHVYLGKYLGATVCHPVYPASLAYVSSSNYLYTLGEHVVDGKMKPSATKPPMRSMFDRKYSYPGMFAHMINSPQGEGGFVENVAVDAWGSVILIAQCGVYYTHKDIWENKGSELLLDYGPEFFRPQA